MKELRTICLLCFLLPVTVALSQTEAKIDIRVLNTSLKPLPGAEVMLREAGSNEQVKGRTNTAGSVSFIITKVGEWHTYIEGYEYKTYVLEVNEDERSTNSFEITHNPALNQRIREQTFDRSNLQPITIRQEEIPAQPSSGFILLHLTVLNSSRQKLAGKKVSVVSPAAKKTFTALTNNQGTVTFHLPNRSKYDIDVEEQLNVAFMDADAREGFTYSKNLVYDTYDLVESRRNDTVTQNIQLPVEKKNSRALFSVFVTKDGKEVANEKVFLNDVSGETVYRAKTSNEGEAVFLLPFGKNYLVHLPFQRDIDVINLTEARGKANGEMRLTYVPNPALEHPEKFIPTKDQLFLTDFPYYHRKPYPSSSDLSKPGFTINRSIPFIRAANKEAILELGISAKDVKHTRRKPLNLSFVLDISGSMAGYERIESLKKGFVQFIDQLSSTDIISIVLFNDRMKLVLPSQQVRGDKQKISELVKAIEPSGGTDMLEALKTGYEQVIKSHSSNVTNAVVLLSDGYDNSNSSETLIKVQQPYSAKISCVGIGVGKDYNYDLMKKLVTNGEGLLNYANEGEELAELFSKRVINLVVPIATDVTITIEHDANLVCQKVYGIENYNIKAGSVSGKLVNLYAGMERPYLIKFTQKPGATSINEYPVTATFKYTNSETGKEESITQKSVINFSSGKDAWTDEELKKMYAVAYTNDCLTAMATAFEKNKLDEVKVALDRGQAKLKELYSQVIDKDISELVYKMKLYDTALKNITYKKKVERY